MQKNIIGKGQGIDKQSQDLRHYEKRSVFLVTEKYSRYGDHTMADMSREKSIQKTKICLSKILYQGQI